VFRITREEEPDGGRRHDDRVTHQEAEGGELTASPITV
jgi:hypothetical protein